MGKHLSTYYCGDRNGPYCEIHANLKEEYFYIKFFNADKTTITTEDFIGKSHRYVQDAAENWTLGIKKL